jgi:ABC-2 type transport system ATP-binding protein
MIASTDEQQTESMASNLLEVRGLKRHYGSVAAVDGINLNVRTGEIYGFLGVNGAGKTTTIRMLMGIIAAEAGSMQLFGETIRRTTVRQKQHIGYVSQEQNFYPWMTCRSLGRFVGSFYPKWDRAEFGRLLELFEIPECRRVSQLSGGMKAKLALALAIAPRPDLLILDEPTAGLDPVARRDFMEIIVAQARQHRRTTFFSSHLIDEVERCADRIGIIHAGKMMFEGELRDLREQVKRITYPAQPFDLPEPFELWNERMIDSSTARTYRANGEAWSQLDASNFARVESLSLEEIFIACVGAKRITL